MNSEERECHDLAADLDRMATGDLAVTRQRAVEDHIATCEACRREVELLQDLSSEVRALPTDIAPPRDLWPEISVRLEPRVAPVRRQGARQVWRVAAAIGWMLLGAGLGRMVDDHRPTVTSPDSGPVGEILPASLGGGTFFLAEAEVLRAKETLRLAIEQRRDDLSPATLKVVERNLEIIDEALADLRGALEEDPGNLRLQELVLAHHHQQVALMRRLTS